MALKQGSSLVRGATQDKRSFSTSFFVFETSKTIGIIDLGKYNSSVFLGCNISPFFNKNIDSFF